MSAALALLLFGAALGAELDELSNGGSLETMSAQGLAQGRLNVVGTLAAGFNDFELELAGPALRTVTLESFDAVMPTSNRW